MKTWEENYLAHYGITGQKWGVRRFQNEDRTLTEAGKERYRKNSESASYSKPNMKSSSWKTDDGYEIEKHEISSKGTDKGRAKIDAMSKHKDYDSASDFDRIGERATAIYEKSGKDAAYKYLTDALKGHEYKCDIRKETEITNGSSYSTYSLTLFGKSNEYYTAGQDNYSDDQSFLKRT